MNAELSGALAKATGNHRKISKAEWSATGLDEVFDNHFSGGMSQQRALRLLTAVAVAV